MWECDPLDTSSNAQVEGNAGFNKHERTQIDEFVQSAMKLKGHSASFDRFGLDPRSAAEMGNGVLLMLTIVLTLDVYAVS